MCSVVMDLARAIAAAKRVWSARRLTLRGRALEAWKMASTVEGSKRGKNASGEAESMLEVGAELFARDAADVSSHDDPLGECVEGRHVEASPQARVSDEDDTEPVLGVHGLDIVEIVSCSMRELKIKVPRSQLAKLENVDQLVDLLHEVSNEAKAS